MQLSDVQERFSQIELSIDDAVRACQQSAAAPQMLKDSIRQLDQRSEEVRQYIQGDDPDRIRQCVNELEALGVRAMHACRLAEGLEPQVTQTVERAHDQLSALKYQMG